MEQVCFQMLCQNSYPIKRVLLFRFLFWDGGEHLHPAVYYAGFLLLLLVLIALLIYLFLWHPGPRRNPIYKKKKKENKRTVEKPENHVFGIMSFE